jgi:CRP-like cAMP-binding protein
MLSEAEVEEMLAPMSADPWFGALGLDIRTAMLERCRRSRFVANQFVFRQGDAPTGLYGVVQGVLKASTLGETGKEGVLAMLEPGNWFGEASAVDGLPRSHDVAALSPVEAVVIEDSEFNRLMRVAGFAEAIARLQARHTRLMYAMIEDATLRSTRSRIVRRLQRLARGDVTMAPVDRRVIHITHETLAMMLGITRQTLALELKEIEAAGAISQSYRRITISSMEILKSIE